MADRHHCESLSDLLETGVLLKEAGLAQALPSPALAIDLVPLFETIPDLNACVGIMQPAFSQPPYRGWLASRGALVRETPRFFEYFIASTPIAEIAELNIGSRPAARRATGSLEDLRAIPWMG